MTPFIIKGKERTYYTVLMQLENERFLIANKKTLHMETITLQQLIDDYAFERTD